MEGEDVYDRLIDGEVNKYLKAGKVNEDSLIGIACLFADPRKSTEKRLRDAKRLLDILSFSELDRMLRFTPEVSNKLSLAILQAQDGKGNDKA